MNNHLTVVRYVFRTITIFFPTSDELVLSLAELAWSLYTSRQMKKLCEMRIYFHVGRLLSISFKYTHTRAQVRYLCIFFFFAIGIDIRYKYLFSNKKKKREKTSPVEVFASKRSIKIVFKFVTVRISKRVHLFAARRKWCCGWQNIRHSFGLDVIFQHFFYLRYVDRILFWANQRGNFFELVFLWWKFFCVEKTCLFFMPT